MSSDVMQNGVSTTPDGKVIFDMPQGTEVTPDGAIYVPPIVRII